MKKNVPPDSALVWRPLLLQLYLPLLCISFASALAAPALPGFARHHLQASDAQLGIMAAARAIGGLVANVPAGLAVQRLGVRRALFVGAAALLLSAMLCACAGSLFVLGSARALGGAASSLYSISQQTAIRQSIPIRHRGRAFAAVGGARPPAQRFQCIILFTYHNAYIHTPFLYFLYMVIITEH